MNIQRIIMLLGFSVFTINCGSGDNSDQDARANTAIVIESTQSAESGSSSSEVVTIEPTLSAALEPTGSETDTNSTDPTGLPQSGSESTTEEVDPTQVNSAPTPDPVATTDPATTPDTVATTVPVATPDTVTTTDPATTPDPVATTDPVTTPDPVEGDVGLNIVARGLLDGQSTGWEQSRDVAFDSMGNIYVVGGTSSADFPVTPGAYDVTYNTGGSERGTQGNTDAFVTKIDPTGNILWSTYLGGPNYDRAYAVEVDDQNNVYVAGRAGNGFPTTPNALQVVFAGDSRGGGPYGNQDGFITKLSSDGSSIIWSTLFGASGPGFIRDIDIDSFNRVHLSATAINGDMSAFVTSNAAQSTRRGDFDSFYARLSADGSTIEYGTYLGGNDTGGYYSGNPAVRVLADGTAYFLSYEPGAGAPTTVNAFQPNIAGNTDFLIARFTPQGSMDFCTYLGGSGAEELDTHSLSITPGGNPVIAGYSTSSDYPVTAGFNGQSRNGDLALSVLSSDGQRLLSSRLLGGSAKDVAEGVDVDAQGNIYISGHTFSSDLAVTQNANVPGYIGERSGLLAVLTEDLTVIRYFSYDGIPGEYAGRSTAVGPDGQWAIVGSAWRIDPFPGTAGQDITINGLHAGFFEILDPM